MQRGTVKCKKETSALKDAKKKCSASSAELVISKEELSAVKADHAKLEAEAQKSSAATEWLE